MKLISVIVTTYNWPEALKACLISLMAQQDRYFEILVADDGSTAKTAELIAKFQKKSIPVHHIRHEDSGFRAGTIRNKAVAESNGEYLLFIDGDCVLFPDFVAKHRGLAEPNRFVAGNRILLSQRFTEEVLQNEIPLHLKTFRYFCRLLWQRKINRVLALVRLPLGHVRLLQPKKWKKAMTCNLGLWKKDFIQSNGFDELFEGWGYEDSDLVIRLIHRGIYRKEGRFAAPVLHLWHRHYDKSRQDINYQRLLERLRRKDFVTATKGVDQYL